MPFIVLFAFYIHSLLCIVFYLMNPKHWILWIVFHALYSRRCSLLLVLCSHYHSMYLDLITLSYAYHIFTSDSMHPVLSSYMHLDLCLVLCASFYLHLIHCVCYCAANCTYYLHLFLHRIIWICFWFYEFHPIYYIVYIDRLIDGNCHIELVTRLQIYKKRNWNWYFEIPYLLNSLEIRANKLMSRAA